MLFNYILLSLCIGSAVSDSHIRRDNHHEIPKRASGDLEKRAFTNARWTFYQAGLGACGDYNSGSDFIVALNSAQFGGGYPGPNCFETITMTYNGKTTQAKIMDECLGCPWGGLDLTEGLFSFFASTGVGVLQGTWSFGGGGGGDSGDDEPKTTKKSKPTSTYHWTPTTTHTTTKKITTTSSTTTTSTKKSSTTADSTSMSKETSIMNGKQFQDVDSALVRMAELTLQFNMNDDDA